MVNVPSHLSLICSNVFVNFVFGNINMVNAPSHLSLICSSVFVKKHFGNINMVNSPSHLSLICSNVFVHFVFGNINNSPSFITQNDILWCQSTTRNVGLFHVHGSKIFVSPLAMESV